MQPKTPKLLLTGLVLLFGAPLLAILATVITAFTPANPAAAIGDLFSTILKADLFSLPVMALGAVLILASFILGRGR